MFTKIKVLTGKAAPLFKGKRLLAAQLALVILTGTMVTALNRSVKTVKIHDEGTVLQIRTAQTDPYKILKLAGCPAGKNDLVLVSGQNDDVIEISRAFPVTVTVDGERKTVQVVEGHTVSDALKACGVVLDGDDYVTPAVQTELTVNLQISVTRVEYTYSTVVKDVSNQHQVTYTYQTKTVGGKTGEVTEVSAKPVSISGGANVISTLSPQTPITLDETGRPVNYTKKLTGKATAYCKGTTCATGVKVRPGYIAVNPKQIPYGTKMYIVSSDGKYNYGYAIAADTGGFAKDGSAIADLYMTSYEDCIQFGRRNIEIYILD
ncbi:MAG: DUF348 domain-containing protein [Clostridia bacterium]|nr:DUF348 domain-containing protein [Clostridia bacterium]